MTEPAGAVRAHVSGLLRAWGSFWFAPRSTATLGLLRIAYGVVMVVWALTLLPDATTLLGADGVVPAQPDGGVRVGLLARTTSDTAVLAVVLGLAASAACLALGAFTRTSGIATFVLLLSITRRDPWITNSGDALLRHLAFYLMFTPAGAALSVDRWRRDRDRFWIAPMRTQWGLRLVQLQTSVIYLFTVFEKVQGDDWVEGSALAKVWRAGDLIRFGVPSFVRDSLLLSNLATYGTLVVELALGTLIWNRRARPYVIVAGMLLHLGIEVTMALGFFSTAMFLLYLSFLSPERADTLTLAVQGRFGRSRFVPLRRLAAAGR